MGTRLAGKVAIVTGSGQGIGRAIGIAFAREGAVVVIATRTAAHGEGTLRLIEAEGGKATFQQVDIADNDATHAMVNEAATACGRLDIMVHNAAWCTTLPPSAEAASRRWTTPLSIGCSTST